MLSPCGGCSKARPARLAAGKVSREVLDAARERIARLRTEGLGDAARQGDRDFHAAIAEASCNPILATAISDLRKRTAMFLLGRLPERIDQVCDEHLDDRHGACERRRRGGPHGDADPHRQRPRPLTAAADGDLASSEEPEDASP